MGTSSKFKGAKEAIDTGLEDIVQPLVLPGHEQIRNFISGLTVENNNENEEIESTKIIIESESTSKFNNTETDSPVQTTETEETNKESKFDIVDENSNESKNPKKLNRTLSVARGSFTRFVKYQDKKFLIRAVNRYIKASGGKSGTLKRMPVSVGFSSAIADFSQRMISLGPQIALKTLNLEYSADRTLSQVLEDFSEYFISDNEISTIDGSVALRSILEVLSETANENPNCLIDDVSSEQWELLFCKTVSNCIKTKILNEIGAKSLEIEHPAEEYKKIEHFVWDYINGAVKDACTQTKLFENYIDQSDLNKVVEKVFYGALQILETAIEVQN